VVCSGIPAVPTRPIQRIAGTQKRQLYNALSSHADLVSGMSGIPFLKERPVPARLAPAGARA
jgi:hypothetical protein